MESLQAAHILVLRPGIGIATTKFLNVIGNTYLTGMRAFPYIRNNKAFIVLQRVCKVKNDVRLYFIPLWIHLIEMNGNVFYAIDWSVRACRFWIMYGKIVRNAFIGSKNRQKKSYTLIAFMLSLVFKCYLNDVWTKTFIFYSL